MKEEFVNDVLRDMLTYLDNGQAELLCRVLNHHLSGFELQKNEKAETVVASEENSRLTNAFLSAKRIEGCSEKSLAYYRKTIETMTEKIGKGITHITTNDLRSYLTDYQTERKSSKVTIDNIRRILSSFFSWLEDEDYILKSPVRRIHKVKTAMTIKETYTDEALETMRDNCETLRDLALIDMLASTGMRVGELVLLNRDDINFEERDNALFVSLKAPYERLQIGGVETRLRELGKRLSLPRVHPHKFRRTLATMAIDKGMPVEQLQRLLGHQRIDTTLQYAMVKQSNVKLAHRKYIG